MDVSRKENVTPYKLREDDDFINAVLDTQVMRTAMNFLNQKGFKTEHITFFNFDFDNGKNLTFISNLIEIILQVWYKLIGLANLIY